MKDLFNHVHLVRAISPVSVADNTAQVSQIVDRRGFDSAMFAILTGSLADADVTFAVLLEESDEAGFSPSNAVADADLLGTEALAGFQFDDDNETRKLGYVGNKRYLRLTITPAGTASAALVAAVAILGHPALMPTANPPV
jgi:hypothetical protein